MSDVFKPLYTLFLPADTEPLQVKEIPALLAKAQCPKEGETPLTVRIAPEERGQLYATTYEVHKAQVIKDVEHGKLPVSNVWGHPHQAPYGRAGEGAFVSIEDFRRYASTLRIEVLVGQEVAPATAKVDTQRNSYTVNWAENRKDARVWMVVEGLTRSIPGSTETKNHAKIIKAIRDGQLRAFPYEKKQIEDNGNSIVHEIPAPNPYTPAEIKALSDKELEGAFLLVEDVEKYVESDGGTVKKVEDDTTRFHRELQKERIPLGRALFLCTYGNAPLF